MTKRDPIPPPKDLSRATREWWKQITDGWEVDEPHHLRLLEAAARAWDRAEEARAQLKADGLTTTDRYGGVRAHPLLAVERDARTQFIRAVRELRLDDAPAPDARPPRNGRRY